MPSEQDINDNIIIDCNSFVVFDPYMWAANQTLIGSVI